MISIYSLRFIVLDVLYPLCSLFLSQDMTSDISSVVNAVYLGQMMLCNILTFFTSLLLIAFYYYFGINNNCDNISNMSEIS